ncbi:MAG: endonuclease/exonuclease/phosphatase family protein [Rhodobacter sp.]|nr:endonuclease/exonuclease/phosphatase family protein [Rhodobacter sp.]
MTKVRIATFNCENLFARYRFGQNVPAPMPEFSINDLSFDIHSTRSKRITGKAIKDIDADIVCLQEVENQPVLDRFNSEFLARSRNKRYRHRVLIDGNDPRHIDVAFLSRYPIKSIRSHRHDRNPANTAQAFSRDCVRVDIDVDGDVLTLYGNHFKSMIGGRRDTRARRVDQAERVHEILTEDWGPDFEGDFVVLGDLNDYPQRGDGTTTALGKLLDDDNLVNVNDRLPRDDRWTHYFARENEYRQLDYLLLSKQLDDASGNPVPERELRGLPWRADEVDTDRYDDVGHSSPKASDHVPLYVDVLVGEANA